MDSRSIAPSPRSLSNAPTLSEPRSCRRRWNIFASSSAIAAILEECGFSYCSKRSDVLATCVKASAADWSINSFGLWFLFMGGFTWIRSVLPRRSGWVRSVNCGHLKLSYSKLRTHPLPRGGTDLIQKLRTHPLPRGGTDLIQKLRTHPLPRGGTDLIQKLRTHPLPRGDTDPVQVPISSYELSTRKCISN